MGHILLAGGGEFGGQMVDADHRAIRLAGGSQARIAIVPAAAAPDDNHHRAGQNGRRWFEGLGAAHVEVLPLIDRSSAGDPEVVAALRQSDLIYMLGGFPRYLADTLRHTNSWSAVKSALSSGAVLAGSSAGAMVLCDHFYSPSHRRIFPGLGLISGACVIPHFNPYGKNWVSKLSAQLPSASLLGIDEKTAMISSDDGLHWRVYGGGRVYLCKASRMQVFEAGMDVNIT